jgi:tetratricopeptide (TPR) repeat protein
MKERGKVICKVLAESGGQQGGGSLRKNRGKMWAGIWKGALLLGWGWGTVGMAQDRLVIFPLENRSRRADTHWIRETLAEIMPERGEASGGLEVVSRLERDRALGRLGLTAEDLLTRGTMIRLAGELGANLALIGEYDLTGPDGPDDVAGDRAEGEPTISLTARLIETREGRLVANRVFRVSGPLRDLQQMEGRLAWNLLALRESTKGLSEEQMVARAAEPPVVAWQSLMKALQTPDFKQREAYLRSALQAYASAGREGAYRPAAYQMGLLAAQLGDDEEAVRQFSLLQPRDRNYLESRFHLGTAAYRRGDYQRMVESLTALIPSGARFEIWNNLGVGLLAGEELVAGWDAIQLALTEHPEDPEVQFNAGYALWRLARYEEALPYLQAVRGERPRDGQVLYLLAKCLAGLGREVEAASIDDQARRYLPSYARWIVRPESIPPLGRLKLTLDSWREKGRGQTEPGRTIAKASPATTQLPTVPVSGPVLHQPSRSHKERIRSLVNDRQVAEALREVEALLRNVPEDAETHLWHGILLERRGEDESALGAFRRAIEIDPGLVEAHLALGRFYLARRDRAKALAHASQALALDPQNYAARSLRRQIEASQ